MGPETEAEDMEHFLEATLPELKIEKMQSIYPDPYWSYQEFLNRTLVLPLMLTNDLKMLALDVSIQENEGKQSQLTFNPNNWLYVAEWAIFEYRQNKRN